MLTNITCDMKIIKLRPFSLNYDFVQGDLQLVIGKEQHISNIVNIIFL